MTAVFSLILPVLAAAFLFAALLFLLRGIQTRRRIGRQVYGVGQVEARREMRIDFIKSLGAFLLGALCLGAWGVVLSAPGSGLEPEVTRAPAPTPTDMAPQLATMTPTDTLPTASPTGVPDSPTRATATPLSTPTAQASQTPPPTITAAPSPPTATVSSGVGVYLRAEPNTAAEQLEWLLDGTVIVLLEGTVQGEEFEWQRVRTPSGREGWVAVPFITFNP